MHFSAVFHIIFAHICKATEHVIIPCEPDYCFSFML